MVSILFTLSTAREKVSLKLNNKPVSQVETPTFLGGTLKTNKSKLDKSAEHGPENYFRCYEKDISAKNEKGSKP